jgi:hypothetical protein
MEIAFWQIGGSWGRSASILHLCVPQIGRVELFADEEEKKHLLKH